MLDKSPGLWYYNIRKRKTKEIKNMKNLWKSTITNTIYEMPIDWVPQFGGWELVGTIEKEG